MKIRLLIPHLHAHSFPPTSPPGMYTLAKKIIPCLVLLLLVGGIMMILIGKSAFPYGSWSIINSYVPGGCVTLDVTSRNDICDGRRFRRTLYRLNVTDGPKNALGVGGKWGHYGAGNQTLHKEEHPIGSEFVCWFPRKGAQMFINNSCIVRHNIHLIYDNIQGVSDMQLTYNYLLLFGSILIVVSGIYFCCMYCRLFVVRSGSDERSVYS